MRTDGRKYNELRPTTIKTEILNNAEGSAQIQVGNTIVMCTASLEEKVPRWLQGSGKGWISAEYGMLPRSTHTRIKRDKAQNGSRSQEISRLIGRVLRSAVDLQALGERMIYVDCDVIQADGGTRTASITGGFVALGFALNYLVEMGKIKKLPLNHYVSAVSIGKQRDKLLLDLNYDEDSSVDADVNFALNSDLQFVELQGTAEGNTFSKAELSEMITLAESGCQELFKLQAACMGSFFELNAPSNSV